MCHQSSLGDYALVIADEVDSQARHRADLSSYREVGTTGYRHRKLTRIVDTLHFAPSHASRLVQAADVITFLYRASIHPPRDRRAVTQGEDRHVEPIATTGASRALLVSEGY